VSIRNLLVARPFLVLTVATPLAGDISPRESEGICFTGVGLRVGVSVCDNDN